MQALIQKLNAQCDSQPFHTGWYLKNLRTGEEANRHGDVIVPSASTRKIAILMAAMRAVHDGRFSLDQPVEILARYQDNKSGTFQHLTPGFTITFQDALVMMIIVSDNTCTGAVADMLGLDDINAFSQSVGMVGTTHRDIIPPSGLPRDHDRDATNTTTPTDVGRLLDLILQGSTNASVAARLGSTPELCQLALDILSWQKLRQRLPALLPEGTKVAHKTGTGVRNNNDAGIIYRGDEPLFILTVYTDHLPREMPDGLPGFGFASNYIAQLCRMCWDDLAR